MQQTPVALATQFTPAPKFLVGYGNTLSAQKGTCVVRVADVRDARANPQSMGEISLRQVEIPDSVAWLRSGLAALGRDARLHFTDTPADATLTLHVEIVKAYMFSLTSDKTTNLVVRVIFSHAGQPDSEEFYRGADVATNWNAGNGETRSAFERAMAEMLTKLDDGIASHCGVT